MLLSFFIIMGLVAVWVITFHEMVNPPSKLHAWSFLVIALCVTISVVKYMQL